MFYALLGRVVWWILKRVARRKLSGLRLAPVGLVGGGAVVVLVAFLAARARRSSQRPDRRGPGRTSL